MNKRLLIVEDERALRTMLRRIVEKEGFDVFEVPDGTSAKSFLERERVDGVLLDLGLPDMDGMEVLRWIRMTDTMADMAVFLVTAKDNEIDTVLGLEMGADDYIVKPFRRRELIARVKATFKRIERDRSSKGELYAFGEVTIFPKEHLVTVGEETMELSPKEFQLLLLLARNPNRVFSRDELLDRIWHDEVAIESRTVDVHIRRIRKKVERNDRQPKYIETVRGMGYRLSK